MKRIIVFLILLYSVVSNSQTIQLVKNNKSEFKIVVSNSAKEFEKLAANELQKYIKEISGVELEIVSENSPQIENEIVVDLSYRGVI